MVAKEAILRKREGKPTEREIKIFQLRKWAQWNEVARRLYTLIELECKKILENPNEVTTSIIVIYNRLVTKSELLPSEREMLVMEIK